MKQEGEAFAVIMAAAAENFGEEMPKEIIGTSSPEKLNQVSEA